MSYGLDLGELIQQYIWLFWPIHTYNSAWFGQPVATFHTPGLHGRNI